LDRRALSLLLVAVVALAGVVNATVFAYRWIQGTVNISGPGYATGAACTGFYSSADQSDIDLPSAGTNYNAPTYGTNTITVTHGDTVCQWTAGSTTYRLYESIEVTIPVTVGSWYIQDFYGFGYKGDASDPTVYVYFRVDQAVSGPLSEAYLRIWKGTSLVAELDLKTSGATTSAITLLPGEALRLDLSLDASSEGTATFKVGVYVTQESGEAPSP